MKKFSKIIVALTLVLTLVLSLAACSSSKSSSGSSGSDNAVLQAILDNFKADEQYNEYKAMFPNTTFEEKVAGDSIILNIKGDEGVSGNYEFVLDGDYLTYTELADSDDYIGVSFFMYLMTAVNDYLGMDSNLVTGYISGCDAFGIENKYFVTETDDAVGTSVYKLYIAGKWNMPELETMYINDKAVEYTSELSDEYISGVINCGKIRAIYYGNKDSADIVFSEFGGRSDLTYQSIMNTVATLLPAEADVFAKYYTELKEAEGDGFKITFGIDDTLIAEHDIDVIDGAEYTVVHFENN